MFARAQAMAQHNAMMDPAQMQQMAMQFERESAKMAITEEMMEDALDSALGGSEDEVGQRPPNSLLVLRRLPPSCSWRLTPLPCLSLCAGCRLRRPLG